MKLNHLYLLLKIAGLLILPVLLYLLCGVLFSVIPVNTSFKEPEEGIEIFIKSNGVHTDIVVPVSSPYIDWREKIKPQYFKGTGSEFKYIGFGWGDKGFYLYTPTWADLKFSTAFNALFWLSTSAMHTTYYENTPVENTLTKKIKISPEQYQQIISHIQTGFRQDEQGEYIALNCCHYSGVNDNFYDGKGIYNLFFTCNSWTNAGLKKAGIKTALWAPFEWSVMRHLKK